MRAPPVGAQSGTVPPRHRVPGSEPGVVPGTWPPLHTWAPRGILAGQGELEMSASVSCLS